MSNTLEPGFSLKSTKSKSNQLLQHENQQLKQKVDQFLKQTVKVKVVYPRKRKSPEQLFEAIRQAKQVEQQQKQTPKILQKLSKVDPKKSIGSSMKQQNFQKDEVLSKHSKVSKSSKYTPKILQSFAVQKVNPQKRQIHSRQTNRSRIKSQKNVFQKSNYVIEQNHMSRRSSSALKNKKMFTEVVGKVGIQDSKKEDRYDEYTDLKGINQYIRRKKNSASSSTFGRAQTQPPQKLQTIQQIKESSFKSNGFSKKKISSRSQNTIKAKLDIYVPFQLNYLPQIQKKQSASKLLNHKMRTQASSPAQKKYVKGEINRELLKKLGNKRSKSPTLISSQQLKPSQKRLRQDFKYVVEKDDSMRINKRSKPLLNQQKKTVKFLKIKEQMLGKIVLDRVQKHLVRDKKQNVNYITRVKSEKSIDQALVEFLKMKVKRADKALNS